MRTFEKQAVPIVNNYYLKDWFSVVLPEAGTNLITNPSIEVDTTGYTAVGAGATIARTLDDQRRGAYSLQINPANAVASGAFFGTITTVTGEAYTFSIDIHGVAGHVYNLYFASNAGAMLGAPYEFVGTGYKERVKITYVETAGAARRFYIVQDAADTQVYYTDGWQVENKAYDTTYIDGDLEGFVTGEVAYNWNGVKHGSTSSRAATTRSGGRVVKLSDYGFELMAMSNLGMPPIQNFSLPLNDGGSFYQNTIEGSRRFSLIGDISAKTFDILTGYRKQLERAFAYNLTPFKQPLLLHFQETNQDCNPVGESVFIKCNYDGGLEGTTDNYNTEKLAIQFVAYDTHSIFADGNRAVDADFKESIFISQMLLQEKDGSWNTLGAGADRSIHTTLYASDGSIYVCGGFTNIGGIAANRIARYNNGTWTALGVGVDDIIRAITEAPNGDIYVGGELHNAGGAAALHIAMWDGAAWNVVSGVGNGLDDIVQDMTFVANGDLIVVGNFLNIDGGGAVTRIARWTPATTTWTAIAAGVSANAQAIERLLASNIVYLVGDFVTANAVTVNKVCKLDTATDTYTAMAGGATGTRVLALAIDKNTNVHIRGDFTAIDGITCKGYAQWNGSQWSTKLEITPVTALQKGITISPVTGDLYVRETTTTFFHYKGSNLQNLGLIEKTNSNMYAVCFPDGSNMYFNPAMSTGALGIARTDLTDKGRIYKQKFVAKCLANTALTHLFRSHYSNQDATIEYTIQANETIEIEVSPLGANSDFVGDFLSDFNPGSVLNLPEFGYRDFSALIVESMVITNDGAGQINDLNMFENVTLANTDAGRIYVEIVDDGAGLFHSLFFDNAARANPADLVGHTASELAVGPLDQTQTMIPDGADGLQGFISFDDLSAADADIYIDVGILESHFRYNQYYSTLYEARY